MTDYPPVTIQNLLHKLNEGWENLNTFIDSLSQEQLTIPTDEAGWTVKDHLMHLAVWEDGIEAALNKQPRYERMGLDEATWNSEGYDKKNGVIQQQHQHKSLAEVRQAFQAIHQRMVATLQKMDEADLFRPYSDFQADSQTSHPIWGYLAGNTFGHYEEHLPWMQAIANKR